jgi:hypothetical protein
MKFLAILLSVCILFFSFSGTVKPIQPSAKKICCHKMAGKPACQNQQKPTQKDDCTNEGCTMLFSCSLCGFLIVEPLTISPNISYQISKPVSLYKIGELSAYHPSDWKPPQAC